MTLLRTATHPVRVIRARARTLRGRQLHRAEVRRAAGLEAQVDRTPIFILGAPRSGTTLLYQLLVDGLDVGWLANAHAEHPNDVVRIEREQQPRGARASSTWTSEHGATRELWEPSEAGAYWYRFVPRAPHQLEDADATPARVHAIRAAVRGFADACAAPVVFKNVFSSLRLPVLAAALPEARYLLIERDVESNARSLLAGRVKRGDLDRWWSASPAGSERVAHLSAAEQVVWQVRQINLVARRELARLAPEASMRIAYDQLCSDPLGTLRTIHEWLGASGADVDLRSDSAIPERFDRRAGGFLPRELDSSLQAALASAPSGEDMR